MTESWTGNAPTTHTFAVPVTKTSGSSAFTTSSYLVVIGTPQGSLWLPIIPLVSSGLDQRSRILLPLLLSHYFLEVLSSRLQAVWLLSELYRFSLIRLMASSTGSVPFTYSSAVPVTNMSGGSLFTDSSNGVVIKTTKLHSTLTVFCTESVPTTYPSIDPVTNTSEGSHLTISTTVVEIGTPTTNSGAANEL